MRRRDIRDVSGCGSGVALYGDAVCVATVFRPYLSSKSR